jgi:RimJ/RimL family protein N-acetyltransferase
MFIRSERLFLRPGWPEDWSEIFSQIADEAVVRNLSRVPWPYTPEAARQFAALGQDPRCPHFLITLPSADGVRLVGVVGLSPGFEAAELGCWIGREHWGQGYATEALRAVLSLARTLGHTRLKAAHFIDNPASARVLHKVGFRPTGRTEERYSLARGRVAPSAIHAMVLGDASDCDDSQMEVKRAA